MSPVTFLASLLSLGQRTFRVIGTSNLDLIAAGVAFYAMLAIFPAFAAVIALWGFVSDPALVERQLNTINGLIPPDAFALLDGQVTALVNANSNTLGWATLVSLGAALWSTRAGVGALIRGLNAIYGTALRPGLWHSVAAVVLTLALVALALSALISVVVVPLIITLLPIGEATESLLVASRWALLVIVGLTGLWLVYRFGPNHMRQAPRKLIPGASLALLLWFAASWGFSTYLSFFNSYNQVYGSIGAVVILLMWFFISAYAVLLGAALNAALDMSDIGD